MTEAECIDCGQWSEALLPARFPHICSLCLFPSRAANEERGEAPTAMRDSFTFDLMDRIDSWKTQGRGVNWNYGGER